MLQQVHDWRQQNDMERDHIPVPFGLQEYTNVQLVLQ